MRDEEVIRKVNRHSGVLSAATRQRTPSSGPFVSDRIISTAHSDTLQREARFLTASICATAWPVNCI